MASKGIQAGAAVFESFLKVGDAGARFVQASTSFENLHSRMKAKIVELDNIKGSVKESFQINWFSKTRFDAWLSNVERISGQVQELEGKISTSRFPQFQNKQISVLCTEIDKVITEGKELCAAMVETDIKRVVKLVTPVSIQNISYLMKQLNQILEYMRKEESINIIRVYGEVGTGKRAILEHLNNHIFENWINEDMFDIVLWVPASDYENRKSIEAGIQDIIARRLGLNIGGSNDLNVRASKINANLDGLKYLLLLDDVREDIDLESIGIPRNNEGSKIVFATSLPYLRPFGPCFFNVEIKRLNEVDSQKMFEDILIKNVSIQQHRIKVIAYKVIKWCNGLFCLIKMVAENFKSRTSKSSWNAGLEMLRKSAEKGDIYI